MSWVPQYTITPNLLNTIRQIGEEIGFIRAARLSAGQKITLQELASQLSTHASTSIEGNPLALTDVRRVLKSKPAHLRNTEREVLNYNTALRDVYKRVKNGAFKLNRSQIERLQKTIVEGLMDNAFHVGRLRQEPVIIRDPRQPDSVVFIPPDAKDVPDLLNALIQFTTEGLGKTDPIILAGLFHRQHVIIHPFMDGNGRTTRLLTTAILGLGGIELFDLFAFENFYNQNVTRYFRKVGAFGDYYDQAETLDHTEWLEYFAEGILDELIRVRGQLKQTGPILRAHHQAVLEYLETRGQITQRDYAMLTDRSLPARKKDLTEMVDWDLIERFGAGRSVHYRLKI